MAGLCTLATNNLNLFGIGCDIGTRRPSPKMSLNRDPTELELAVTEILERSPIQYGVQEDYMGLYYNPQ
eukprot:3092471-Ditylum_brightwellii.AAC.1